MRILITNDDGLNAAGLVPLIKWCKKLGEVVTVVPKYEQSGKSHSIELHKAFEARTVTVDGIEITTVDSSPADCVRFAVMGMKKEFDLVISGINKGLNMGVDIMYSGTAGAVFEAAALGIKAVAVSISPKNYPRAIEPLDSVLAYFKEHKLFDLCGIYNVNMVPDAKGIRITRQGGPFYSDDFVPQGNDMYLPTGKLVYENQHNLTLDSDCVMSGYISIMPLSINRADTKVYEELKALND